MKLPRTLPYTFTISARNRILGLIALSAGSLFSLWYTFQPHLHHGKHGPYTSSFAAIGLAFLVIISLGKHGLRAATLFSATRQGIVLRRMTIPWRNIKTFKIVRESYSSGRPSWYRNRLAIFLRDNDAYLKQLSSHDRFYAEHNLSTWEAPIIIYLQGATLRSSDVAAWLNARLKEQQKKKAPKKKART